MIQKKRGRKNRRPTQEELETLYSGMTAKEVGNHYGVAEQTVYTWLNYYRKEELKKSKGGDKIKKRARRAL